MQRKASIVAFRFEGAIDLKTLICADVLNAPCFIELVFLGLPPCFPHCMDFVPDEDLSLRSLPRISACADETKFLIPNLNPMLFPRGRGEKTWFF